MTTLTARRRRLDKPHPSAIPFGEFVSALGGRAIDEQARDWICRSYRKESLVRFGAERTVATLRYQKSQASRVFPGTQKAVDFCSGIGSISGEDEHRFYRSGVNRILSHMQRGGPGFAYDRTTRTFSSVVIATRRRPSQERVLSALSGEPALSRHEIAAKCGLSQDATRILLFRMRRLGLVVLSGSGRHATWRTAEGGSDGR